MRIYTRSAQLAPDGFLVATVSRPDTAAAYAKQPGNMAVLGCFFAPLDQPTGQSGFNGERKEDYHDGQ
jgi:hypothetical protein